MDISNQNIYTGELEWGMFLICESGSDKTPFPTPEKLANAAGKGLHYVADKSAVVILTESHVEGKEVTVRIEDKPRPNNNAMSRFSLQTKTGKLYLGDILKSQFIVMDFASEGTISLGIIISDTAEEVRIKLYFDQPFTCNLR